MILYVLFTDYQSAKQKIIDLAKETDTDIKEWNIRTFIEGKCFRADLASY